jgi:hypothetical protein
MSRVMGMNKTLCDLCGKDGLKPKTPIRLVHGEDEDTALMVNMSAEFQIVNHPKVHASGPLDLCLPCQRKVMEFVLDPTKPLEIKD